MKNINIPEEQFNLILQALGIAESTYTDVFTTIRTKLIQTRHNPDTEGENSRAIYYHKKACDMADLLIDLKNGIFDIGHTYTPQHTPHE